MSKTILGALSVLIVLVLVYAVFAPPKYLSTKKDEVAGAFKSIREARFDDTARITIAKGKAAPVELKKAGSEWVVATSYGYPADKEKVDGILKSLDKIENGEERGRSEKAHEDFEVDAKKGGTVTAFSADGKELARVVVGKTAPGRDFSSTRVFLRFGNEPATYAVESDIRNAASLWSKDVEAKSFLQKKPLKLADDMEPQAARLIRPGKPDVIVERKSRDVVVDKPEDKTADPAAATPPAGEEGAGTAEGEKKEEEKKPETKKEEYFVVTSGTETHEVGKNEEWSAKGLLTRVKDLAVEDAAEPKELSAYGLDNPQLKAVVSYRKKDQADAEMKTVTLLFGNAKKDEKGTTTSYYFALEGAEHQGRIYLIQQYSFDSWNKEMKDFLPKPKEEPKPAETPKPDAAGAGTPAVPAPEGSPAPPGAAPAPAPGAAPAPLPAPAPPAEEGKAAPPAPPPAEGTAPPPKEGAAPPPAPPAK